MEKGLKAFFYDYKYYLLPDSCESIEDLKKEETWEVKRLKEELCMAPNFIYESIETELLTIEDPDRIFPAEVNLYEGKEYDDLLRKQVDCVCPKCERYTDDGDPSLNGHHREISLDGVCYLRETKEERWSFAFCAQVVWDGIAEKSEELLKYVKKNKQDKIQDIVCKELDRFFLPNLVYGGYDENGPCLAFYADDYQDHPGVRLILKMLAETANAEDCDMKKLGWTVYPYYPKGMLPPCKKPDYTKKAPRIFMRVDEETENVHICFFEPKFRNAKEKAMNEIGDAAYQYLCYCVGENVLLGGCASYRVVGEIPEDMQEVSIPELERELLRRAQPEEEMTEPFFPSPYFCGEYEEEPEMLPFKKDLEFMMTVCPELSPEKKDESIAGGNTVFESFGLTYAYLYMPKGNEESNFNERAATLVWYAQHLKEYPAPISDVGNYTYMKRAGMTITKEGYCEDLLVFDEKAFFRWMRHLTPVLKGLDVKIVTVKRDGVVVYDPDYRIVAEGSDWLN